MLLLVTTVVAAVAAFVGFAYVRGWRWTGFTASSRAGVASPDSSTKTLWDWLQLLIIPLALAAVGFALNAAQSAREQRGANDRANRERELAADRARELALDAYLNRMSELMLSRNLLRSSDGSDVQTVARTLTLTTLRRLDGPRKGSVVSFLDEAGLIERGESGSNRGGPRVPLVSADLRGIVLRDGVLENVSLLGTRLEGADFSRELIINADFSVADLRRAVFRGAILSGAASEANSFRVCGSERS